VVCYELLALFMHHWIDNTPLCGYWTLAEIFVVSF
jgi:hypothetical protein